MNALLFVLALTVGQSIGPKQLCIYTDSSPLIDAAVMSGSPSFSINRPNLSGGFNILRLFLRLTDADSSITRFDWTCTVSDDGNATDYTPQECTVAAGVATCVNAGVWQKATPGTANWSYRVDTSGWPDMQCTASVGAGAATAVVDVLTVTGMYCTE